MKMVSMMLDRVASDFLRGYVVGKVEHIYERKPMVRVVTHDKGEKKYRQTIVMLALPSDYVATWDSIPETLVLLKTDRGDLVIMNPDHAKRLSWAFEAIIKANKIRATISRNVKKEVSLLWPVLRKYVGVWKSADKRRGVPRKKWRRAK